MVLTKMCHHETTVFKTSLHIYLLQSHLWLWGATLTLPHSRSSNDELDSEASGMLLLGFASLCKRSALQGKTGMGVSPWHGSDFQKEISSAETYLQPLIDVGISCSSSELDLGGLLCFLQATNKLLRKNIWPNKTSGNYNRSGFALIIAKLSWWEKTVWIISSPWFMVCWMLNSSCLQKEHIFP